VGDHNDQRRFGARGAHDEANRERKALELGDRFVEQVHAK
jgi:hypothetical protein